MKAGDMNVLIVAEDSHAVASLARELVLSTAADISIVDTLEDARILSAGKRFDVIVAAAALDDGSGHSLIDREGAGLPIPVIILEETADAADALAAIRAGAADVLTSPYDTDRFIASVRRLGREHRRQRFAAKRSARLRKLTSRVIRDRRELRQRVDLICRDLVVAYRRLAEKVVARQSEEPAADAQ
jgi:DNA-binding NtrC family response regulator